MNILSKEQFLAACKNEPRVFQSDMFGGAVKYRLATVGDKATARRKATKPDGLDEEEFELQLIAVCLIEPKLSDMDVAMLRDLPVVEISRLAKAVSGVSENP